MIWGNGDADLFKGAFYLVGEEKVWEEAWFLRMEQSGDCVDVQYGRIFLQKKATSDP